MNLLLALEQAQLPWVDCRSTEPAAVQRRQRLRETVFSGKEPKRLADSLRIGPIASHAMAKFGLVQPPAACASDEAFHALLRQGIVFAEPVEEHGSHR
jgi:hypothetical protein